MSGRQAAGAKKKLGGYEAFFPGESHTLAGLIRCALPARTERDVVACVVTDELHGTPGLRVQCASREGLLAALDDARAWVREARKATAVEA